MTSQLAGLCGTTRLGGHTYARTMKWKIHREKPSKGEFLKFSCAQADRESVRLPSDTQEMRSCHMINSRSR